MKEKIDKALTGEYKKRYVFKKLMEEEKPKTLREYVLGKGQLEGEEEIKNGKG